MKNDQKIGSVSKLNFVGLCRTFSSTGNIHDVMSARTIMKDGLNERE